MIIAFFRIYDRNEAIATLVTTAINALHPVYRSEKELHVLQFDYCTKFFFHNFGGYCGFRQHLKRFCAVRNSAFWTLKRPQKGILAKKWLAQHL